MLYPSLDETLGRTGPTAQQMKHKGEGGLTSHLGRADPVQEHMQAGPEGVRQGEQVAPAVC